MPNVDIGQGLNASVAISQLVAESTQHQARERVFVELGSLALQVIGRCFPAISLTLLSPWLRLVLNCASATMPAASPSRPGPCCPLPLKGDDTQGLNASAPAPTFAAAGSSIIGVSANHASARTRCGGRIRASSTCRRAHHLGIPDSTETHVFDIAAWSLSFTTTPHDRREGPC
ncbi:hypothetical protein [Streptomyces sp. NBC_01264]|uniref:hypothetical protein n=1 Tax=Streptomyces sp. NBC_01264 TaxID=2903804 RepID=UPI00225B967A|nr:hypothetical protein [Streptomyces sp. NBC_01264]MCX4783997.1 hypothetical protein [Streptomyces sp. NBC_01264]